MRYLLFTLICLNILFFAGCRGSAPQSESAPAQPATTVSAPAPAKSLAKIVALGDSLTAGFGLPAVQSYPALLQNRLDADGYQYEVVNAGVSGDTSAGGLRRIDWALEGDVKIVILELGANDFLRGQSVVEMKKNLGQIIERAQARGAKVLLAGMEAPTSFGPEYRKEVHDAYAELAEKYKLPLIPFFLEGVAGNPQLNLTDGIHPNETGTKIVAETVYKHLKPLLVKN